MVKKRKSKEAVYWDRTIKLVMKGWDGEKEEYWDGIPVARRFKVFDELNCESNCVNCGVKLCKIASTVTVREDYSEAMLCSSCCNVLTRLEALNNLDHVEGYSSLKTYEMCSQMEKIYELRENQISIKAVLTLLNHRSQHRLPNDLIRTLKGYLY